MNASLAALTGALRAPAPWWGDALPLLRRVLARCDHQPVAQALNEALPETGITLPAGRLRFVAHEMLPEGEAYEAFIARSACVPTRDNPHDLLNGIAWLRFPATKRQLNALQSKELARTGGAGPRGDLRDALTLFDENAALWHAPAPLVQALRDRDWAALFIDHRSAWADCRPVLFGHALMEKLLQPRKAITAHVWLLPQGTDDGAVAATLDPAVLARKPFLPLPVLGVPGWWPGNDEAGFYADEQVFRPARR